MEKESEVSYIVQYKISHPDFTADDIYRNTHIDLKKVISVLNEFFPQEEKQDLKYNISYNADKEKYQVYTIIHRKIENIKLFDSFEDARMEIAHMEFNSKDL